MQAFTSAATGVISALASKPNVQLPDLSNLFSKRSFNLTLPTFTMPTISMPNMDLVSTMGSATPYRVLVEVVPVLFMLCARPIGSETLNECFLQQ